MKQSNTVSFSLSANNRRNRRSLSLLHLFSAHKRALAVISTVLLLLRSSVVPNFDVYTVPDEAVDQIEYNPKETWGIVHLGKCGGVSMRFTLDSEPLPLPIRDVSRNAKWYHIAPPEGPRFKKWILLVRDPIARIQSWYMYDHPDNFQWRTDRFGWPVRSQKAKELFECYPTLDKLAAQGMVEYSESNSKCQHLAHMAIPYEGSGWLTGLQHVRWNFFRYYDALLKEKGDKQFFVVRAEHMEYDLNRINRFLGGSGKLSRVVHQSHWENTSYPMTDRSISEEGLTNLCQQLCNEIQLYKTVLRSGLNLNERAYAQSMDLLKPNCPVQVDTELCPPRAESQKSYRAHMYKLLVEEVAQLGNDKEEWRLKEKISMAKASQDEKSQKMVGLQSTAVGFIEVALTGGENIRETLQGSEASTVLGEKFQAGEWFSRVDPDISKYKTLVVTLSDPIERIKAWWVYDHPENQKFKVDTETLKRAPPAAMKQRNSFFECFKSLEELVSVGLRPVHSYNDANWDECQKVARRAIPRRGNGIVPTLHALNFNYERVFQSLLRERQTKSIFVIRSQQFQRGDAAWVNKLLGGSETDFQQIQKAPIWTIEEERLPVSPGSIQISKNGMKNLCGQLCREIQVYKMLILDALNLRERAYAEAVDKIEKYCPAEADLDFDRCP